MTTTQTKTLASTLYRAMLSSAKRYGEGAQKRSLPARKEMETFNSVLKSTQLPLPDSGIMSPRIAMSAVKQAFREQSASQESDKINDAFAMLRKLYQKEGVLKFPQSASSECITDGCKIAAKSCYLHERPPGWFFWDYNIKIYNNTEVPLQLFSEKLRILDENLVERKIESALITFVKPLPVIQPGQHFEFTKRVPIRTKTGSLSGSYTFMDVQNGKLFQASIAPLLLTQQDRASERIGEEIVTDMDSNLNKTKNDGDEDTKSFEPLTRDGARRRRLRREELKDKQESEEVVASEADQSDVVIPDSELKKQIRQNRFHLPKPHSHSQSSPSFPPKFNKLPSRDNSTSSRSRAIQRATPVTSPDSSSSASPQKNEQLELEPEGTK